jgi:hypothetical protein
LYWDIFRDYLNTKKVPVQENYILRVQIAPVWKATKLLVEAGGLLTVDEFRKRAGLSQNSAYNVIRDMRMLGLASAGEGKLQLALEFAAAAKDREISNQLRNYLHERLTRNRVVSRILETLERESAMTVEELSHSLCVWCPYVSATEATWNMYAVNLANWLDLSDLAVYERREKSLSYLKPDMQLRERDISVPKRRAGTLVPLIQYTPVERVALEIVEVFTRKRSSLGEMKKSTRAKSLGMLEDLGFLRRIKGGYTMGTPIHLIPEFIESPEYRRKVFAHEIQKIASFSVFLEILDRHRDRKVPINELARELCEKLGADWKEGTASVNAKIMLDWARHTGLAPAVFARGQAKE